MSHFVRIVYEQNDALNESLDESIVPKYDIMESEQGARVLEIPLDRELTDDEADGYADKLSAYLFAEGFEDFDIEISTDAEQDLSEETYDGDDFFEEGLISLGGISDEKVSAEAEAAARSPLGEVRSQTAFFSETGSVSKSQARTGAAIHRL